MAAYSVCFVSVNINRPNTVFFNCLSTGFDCNLNPRIQV